MPNRRDRQFLVVLLLPWLLWGLCLAGLLPRVAAGQWGWGIAVFVAGALLQYWCIIAIHEAIHQYFVTRHRLNGLVALLCAFPIGLDRNYSWLHLDHHKHFPAADIDPDGPMYRDFPSSLTQWIRRLLLNASGLQVVFQVFEQRRQHAARPIRRHYFRHEWAWKLLVQLTLLVLFAVLGFAPGYVLFWLLPLVTLAKLLSFLRTFAEHAHPQYPGALRVFAKPSWLDHYLAYFGFLYHSEHHLRANVPYGDLPQRSLQDAATKPAGAVMIVVYDGGHLGWHCQLLKSLWRAARRDDGTQHRNIPNERVLYLPILPGADLHHRPVADS